MTIKEERTVMDAADMTRTLKRIAFEILDRDKGPDNLVLVGLQTRGVHIARRIAQIIESIEKVRIPVGVLDVTMYRDDIKLLSPKHKGVQETSIPVSVDGKIVVLVDDVFFTGRTVRSALDAIIDFGRPSRIRLAVLIDRGHRELPLKTDFVGKKIPTEKDEEIRVRMMEEDGIDEVTVVKLAEDEE